MSTVWGRRRKSAREAGAYAAQGGPDRRREFDSLGVVHAYDEGYQNEIDEMQVRKDQDDRLAPLREISREANMLVLSAQSSESAELARLIERLADYLLEKENG